jgi:organic radical activating enzyme
MSPEVYVPTPEERRQVLMPRGDDEMIVSGDGVFATLQGEGLTSGRPAVFLRLHHCNLECGGSNGGWRCDTWYTWDKSTPEFWQESSKIPVDLVRDSIALAWDESFEHVPDGRRLVVTGGEPLLQQKKIARLVSGLLDWSVEIETNGTVSPAGVLRDAQINCSPKLANSGNPLKKRYKPEVLHDINGLPQSSFKFVVQTEDDLSEVERIVHEVGMDADKVLIMPEGHTAETVAENAERIARRVGEYGWKLIMRNQLIWFGDKRRT